MRLEQSAVVGREEAAFIGTCLICSLNYQESLCRMLGSYKAFAAFGKLLLHQYNPSISMSLMLTMPHQTRRHPRSLQK